MPQTSSPEFPQDFDQHIKAADAAVTAAECEWAAQRGTLDLRELEKANLSRETGVDPRPRVKALRLKIAYEDAIAHLNELKAERSRLEHERLSSAADGELGTLQREHAAAVIAQKETHAAYEKARAKRYALQGRMADVEREITRVGQNVKYHEGVAADARENANAYRTGIAKLEDDARAMVADERQMWIQGLASWVASLESREAA